jgi:hypothetical protein
MTKERYQACMKEAFEHLSLAIFCLDEAKKTSAREVIEVAMNDTQRAGRIIFKLKETNDVDRNSEPESNQS